MARGVLGGSVMIARLVVLLCLAAGVSVADEPPIADSVLAVVKDHGAVVTTIGGLELAGVVVAYDGASVTLVENGTHRVVAVTRSSIASVRLTAPPVDLSMRPPAPPLAPSSDPPAKARHVGLLVGLGPGNVYLDVDYGHFYGFIGTSIGYPIILSGGSDTYFGFALGAGGSWKLSPRSNWKFDLVGTLTPTWWDGFSAGIGVSAGFHYTSPNGFTFGVKIPIIGVAPGCNAVFSDYGQSDNHCSQVSGGTNLVLNYYLQAAMTLPTVTVGYRF